MRATLGDTRLISLAAGLLLGIAAVIIAVGDNTTSTQDLLDSVEADLNADFQTLESSMRDDADEFMAAYMDGKEFKEADPAILRIVFSLDSVVEYWNNSEFIPPTSRYNDLLKVPDGSVLNHRKRIWYVTRAEFYDHILVSLVPLYIDYDVHNDFLEPDMFLGRYESRAAVQSLLARFEVAQRPDSSSMDLKDKKGEYLLSITPPDDQVFRQGRRQLVATFAFLAIGLLMLGLFLILRRRYSEMVAALVVMLALPLVRVLFFYFDFPGAYLDSPLFSPSYLAVNDWNASLGDFTLNVCTGFVVVFLLVRIIHRPLSIWYRSALDKTALAWGLNIVLLGLSAFVLSIWFQVFEVIIENASVYFEFMDILKMDVYSMVFFGNIGLILGIVLMILVQLGRFSFFFVSRSESRALTFGASVLVFLGFEYLVMGGEWLPILTCLVVMLMLGLVFRRKMRWSIFRSDFLEFLTVVIVFTLLTMVSVSRGIDVKRTLAMESMAHSVAEERDLITESLYGRAVDEVFEKSLLLQYGLEEDEVHKDFRKWLYEKFFAEKFKGYEVNVFVFDSSGVGIHNEPGKSPHNRIDVRNGFTDFNGNIVSENLAWMPFRKGEFEYHYMGLFDLQVAELGKVYVQVEMFPDLQDRKQLYPQLLLDRSVKVTARWPKEYSYAVYRDSRIIRRKTDLPFALQYEGPKNIPVSGTAFSLHDDFVNLYYRPTEEKMVQVRVAQLGFFDHVNIFSFIFYFYIIAFIVLFLPLWLFRLRTGRSRFMALNLREKLQIFLLGISVLPLIVVVIFLSPYVKQRFQENVTVELIRETGRLAELLKTDYLEIDASTQFRRINERRFKERLEELETEIFKDINVYDKTGRIHFTTQPSIYELGLTSDLMNPAVFSSIKSGQASESVIEDRIGGLQFFSGFYPIVGRDSEVAGFLNIPYLSRQDEMNEQSQSLLAFLVDIYVLVLLSIGIMGVLLGNTITRPLNLLRKKLEDTTLGNPKEPIDWNSQDEIGEIIRSYNQMLDKLSVSEKRLAQSERELAWKEMARQVAHEIKNPLTPMKLSVQHLLQVLKSGSAEEGKKVKKVTDTLLGQIDQLASIANSFSEFARMPEPKLTRFAIEDVISDVAELYAHHEQVQLQLHLPNRKHWVHSDKDQLSRVFNNLVKNGIQAIEHENGEITIDFKENNGSVQVSVSDNGSGIPEELSGKVFQPNFSTKTSGMGLGLAMVRQIVETSGGRVWFESELGKGTTFYVEIPESVELG